MFGILIALCLAGITGMVFIAVMAYLKDLDDVHQIKRGNKAVLRELRGYLERYPE